MKNFELISIGEQFSTKFKGKWSLIECYDNTFLDDLEKELFTLIGEEWVKCKDMALERMSKFAEIKTGHNAIINKGAIIWRTRGLLSIQEVGGGIKVNPSPSTFTTYTEFQEKLNSFAARKLGTGSMTTLTGLESGIRTSLLFRRPRDNNPGVTLTELGIVVNNGNKTELLNRIVGTPMPYTLSATSDTIISVEIDEIYN